MRIIDIALEYGFEYEQSYIRAFRKKFGHTPLKVRLENLSFIIKEKLNIHDILSVNNSIIYKPFFVYKPKFYLVGNQYKIVSKSGDKTANSYGNNFYYNHKQKIVNAINSGIYFGIQTGVEMMRDIFIICPLFRCMIYPKYQQA
ncbi:MAG: transcriptional regulator with only domain, AraC family [Neobacillus sp.]|jgi:AraC family transcriptional regulator|nr:transcriptional regulator with only domain, AraC family [Neobacillus sp.]